MYDFEPTLRCDDGGKDRKDEREPKETSSNSSGDGGKEDILNDVCRIDDELGSLTEIRKQQRGINESDESQSNRLLGELTETVNIQNQ